MLIEPRQVGGDIAKRGGVSCVEGSYGILPDGKPLVNGHWYVVRVPENGFEELKTDLSAEMEHRRRKMSSSLPAWNGTWGRESSTKLYK
jgi:hypothetical protein